MKRQFILYLCTASFIYASCQPVDEGDDVGDTDTVGEGPRGEDCQWSTDDGPGVNIGFTPARLIDHIHKAATSWEASCEGKLSMSAWTVADLPCGIQCWATADNECDLNILSAAEVGQCRTPEEVVAECFGQMQEECDRYAGPANP